MCKNNCVDGKIALFTSVVDCEICSVSPIDIDGRDGWGPFHRNRPEGEKLGKDSFHSQSESHIHGTTPNVQNISREQKKNLNFGLVFGGSLSYKAPEKQPPANAVVSDFRAVEQSEDRISSIKVPVDESCMKIKYTDFQQKRQKEMIEFLLKGIRFDRSKV